MFSYLIQSTFCAGLLLVFYHLFLLPEKINRFKRGYLLLALTLSLVMPLVPIPIRLFPNTLSAAFQSVTWSAWLKIAQIAFPEPGQSTAGLTMSAQASGGTVVMLYIYILISILLLSYTIWQLFRFRRLIRYQQVAQTDGIKLIYLPGGALSFSFMRFVCIAPTDFDTHTGKPINDIYLHERAHARGLHSLDVLFVALIQAACWWNPFIFLYRKAIRLNHEFLADEAVLNNNGQPADYQRLLLSRLQAKPELTLASTTIYSLTKKRFKMMNQHTSRRKSELLQIATACFAGLCLTLFSQQIVAQDTAHREKAGNVKTDSVHKTVLPKAADTHGIIKHKSKSDKQKSVKANKAVSQNQQKTTRRIPPPPPVPGKSGIQVPTPPVPPPPPPVAPKIAPPAKPAAPPVPKARVTPTLPGI